MSDKTGIEWTDATWNPIRGCSKVDLDCRHCYAETMAARFAGPATETKKAGPYHGTIAENGHWNGQIRTVPEHMADPMRWQKPRRIFVNSMSDLFHENVAFEYIAAVFGVMAAAPRHTFQVLTKRPERAIKFFDWLNAAAKVNCQANAYPAEDLPWVIAGLCRVAAMKLVEGIVEMGSTWPLPNVWVGTSVGYEKAKHRIDQLREVPAAVRFLSIEPMHGRVGTIDLTGIHWVIVGGESGQAARPMHPDWAREIRDQCVAAGVPFFFKQWGEWADVGDAHELAESGSRASGNERVVNLDGGFGFHGRNPRRMRWTGKHTAGRQLDGREWNEYP